MIRRDALSRDAARRDLIANGAVMSRTARPPSVSRPEWTAPGEWTGKQVSGGLTIELEWTHPIVRLRPFGVLDSLSAPDLRAALLEAVAEQPAGVVIEVDHLDVADGIGLAVVATVAQQNRKWPGTSLVLAGPNDHLHEEARRLGVLDFVPMCPDRSAALAHLEESPVPPRRREHIAPDRNAPGVARTAVAAFCAELEIGGDAKLVSETAQLVASELVTNAVVHAGTPIELTLRLVAPLLHIAVRDHGAGHAKITGLLDESAESGRGLVLVEALSSSWGNFVPPFGKIVWATVRVRPAPVFS